MSFGSQTKYIGSTIKPSDAFLQKLWEDVLFPATEEKDNDGDGLADVRPDGGKSKYPHILISVSNNKLSNTEVLSSLFHDAAWAGGSFCAVGGLVLFHLKFNFFLFFAGMYGVIIAFPTAFYFFFVQFGFKDMVLLNFVALFLLLGIGADDIFVLYDT